MKVTTNGKTITVPDGSINNGITVNGRIWDEDTFTVVTTTARS